MRCSLEKSVTVRNRFAIVSLDIYGCNALTETHYIHVGSGLFALFLSIPSYPRCVYMLEMFPLMSFYGDNDKDI